MKKLWVLDFKTKKIIEIRRKYEILMCKNEYDKLTVGFFSQISLDSLVGKILTTLPPVLEVLIIQDIYKR